jgi:hypothetical protein
VTVSYGRDNPLTREKIAERIGQLDAINGVLVAQLCWDTADMLRQILPAFQNGGEAGRRSYASISDHPDHQSGWRLTLEFHFVRDADDHIAGIMRALRAHHQYLMECDRHVQPGPPGSGAQIVDSDVEVIWLATRDGHPVDGANFHDVQLVNP